MYSAYPSPCVHAQVQAVSAQGVGNYTDPASVTVESFPAAYTVAIVTAVASLAVTVAFVIVLACLIWQCYTSRRCVSVCAYAWVGGRLDAWQSCVLIVVVRIYTSMHVQFIHAIVEH